jgi:spectinomycin phosphotransferase
LIEKPPLPDPLIIDHLKTDYGIQVAMLTFLPLGADLDASLFKAQAADQASYFVKLKRGHHHDIGVAIVELLHKAGIQQIIPPIQTIHGRPTQRIGDFTLIVYPFVEGPNGFHCHLTDSQWLQLGKAIRQVHEFDVPPSIQNRLRREEYSPKWREAVQSLYAHLESEPVDEVASKLLKFMKGKISAIRILVERSEGLAQKLQDLSPQFVLCHSDIHAGNVLLEGDDRIYLVDWDDPIMAPKERDLMFIGGGIGNVWNRPHEEKLFFKGYGKTEVNGTILVYYRHERIVEDIASYGRELLLKNTQGKERLVMYEHFIDMFAPRGVVDIAFETDENYC